MSRTVDVVIPTTGRASLRAAVDSARMQPETRRIWVVADCAPKMVPSVERLVEGMVDVSVTSTGGGRGGSVARHIGTQRAETDWVAYLDDDDVWFADKLKHQLELVPEHAGDHEFVLSCQVRSVSTDGHEVIAPRTVYESGDVARYLFYRRRLGADRNLMPTSTLVVTTSLAKRAGWSDSHRRHHDWGFVLRCVSPANGGRLIQADRALVEIALGAEGSMTRSPDWKASLEWFDDIASDWERDVRVDFLVGQVLRYALQSHSPSGVRAVLRRTRGLGRPSTNAVAIALAGALPRRTMEHAMHVRKGRRETQ